MRLTGIKCKKRLPDVWKSLLEFLSLHMSEWDLWRCGVTYIGAALSLWAHWYAWSSEASLNWLIVIFSCTGTDASHSLAGLSAGMIKHFQEWRLTKRTSTDGSLALLCLWYDHFDLSNRWVEKLKLTWEATQSIWKLAALRSAKNKPACVKMQMERDLSAPSSRLGDLFLVFSALLCAPCEPAIWNTSQIQRTAGPEWRFSFFSSSFSVNPSWLHVYVKLN